MKKSLPSAVSVDDAIALILNIDYLPGSTSPIEMFSYFHQEAEVRRDQATNAVERDKYDCLAVMHGARQLLGRSILDALDAEISSIRKGATSYLEVIDDEFGGERLVTASVLEWAKQNGFGVDGWAMPRHWRRATSRTFSTEYLDILDDVIATFCEEGGEYYQPGVPPKKEVITHWVREKYGEVSDKVLDVLGTLIRPGLTNTTKQHNKK